jgi:hypothetical protein
MGRHLFEMLFEKIFARAQRKSGNDSIFYGNGKLQMVTGFYAAKKHEYVRK